MIDGDKVKDEGLIRLAKVKAGSYGVPRRREALEGEEKLGEENMNDPLRLLLF